MAPLADVHVRTETLPDAPVAQITIEHRRVVDPHFYGALHSHEHVARSSAREEGFGVKDSFVHVLGCGGEAAMLFDLEDMRGRSAHRVGRPGEWPRPGLLRRKSAPAIDRGSASEGTGDADALGAAHACVDESIVGVAGGLGLVERLSRRPLDELRDGAPPEGAGPRDDRIEACLVVRKELGDRSAKGMQAMRGNPSDELGVGILAHLNTLQRANERFGGAFGISVRFASERKREASVHALVLRLLEALHRGVHLGGVSPGGEHFGERPAPDDLAVVRRFSVGANGADGRGASERRWRRGAAGDDRERKNQDA
jgi:hypothetical protein